MNIFQGVSASQGIATGTAFVLADKKDRSIKKIEISQELIESEWLRFEVARLEVLEYFRTLLESGNDEQKAIFESYLLMLSDPEFIALVKRTFEDSYLCIEWILHAKVTEFADQLKMAQDEYLSQRADDILDVYGKVLDKLTGTQSLNIDTIPLYSVLVAESLSPSDAIILSKKSISALVLHEGGKNSHLSILARTYGIPLIFGIKNAADIIETGSLLIIDGNTGRVITEPDEKTDAEYKKLIDDEIKKAKKLSIYTSKNAQTKDGVEFSFMANIGSVEDAKEAVKEGAAGIGLFRTEFLFMTGSQASISEEGQFEAYKEVLQIMNEKPVTIRTLDAGGDKIIEKEGMPSGDEKNPLLGWRAIRFCLDRTDIFKTQLRALFRASMYGNLKIMIPLLSHPEQLYITKQIIEEVKADLTNEGLKYKEDIPIGIMIETPAASVMADTLAKEVDFFSIGTNDLTQYMLCIDRENTIVSNLFQETHPAIIRQIQYTLVSGEAANIPVSVCGEMASKPETIVLLLGLGSKTLSMAPSKLSAAKEFISHFTYNTLVKTATKAALCTTSEKVDIVLSKCISASQAE